MRILQVGRYFPPQVGGIETLVYNLTVGLNNQGIRCDVLCSNKEARYRLDNIQNFTVHRTASFGQVFSVSITPQLITKLKEIGHQYDIIHLHHPDPVATAALFYAKPDCKVVVHWHSDILRQKLPLLVFKPLQDWMLRRADAIITTSPNYAWGSAHLARFLDKIHVIPIGIPPLSKKVTDDQIQAKRLSIGDRKVIFSLGRLVYYKGFEHLIDAADFLDDSYLILIGGDGPLHRRLARRVEKKNLEKQVRILGQIPPDELALYYELADVFCLPSTYKTEAFGIVLLEAMSRGKPLVTTNLQESGLSWVNQHDVTGLTVPPNDARALASAIDTIANDKDLARKFSMAAKSRFQEKFTADAMVDATIRLYSSLMSENTTISKAAIPNEAPAR